MGLAQAGILSKQIQSVYKIQLEAMKMQCNKNSSERTCGQVDKIKVPENFEEELKGILCVLNKSLGVDDTVYLIENLIAIHNCTHVNKSVGEENHPLTKLFFY